MLEEDIAIEATSKENQITEKTRNESSRKVLSLSFLIVRWSFCPSDVGSSFRWQEIFVWSV